MDPNYLLSSKILNKYLPPLIAYCACPTLSRRKTPHNFSFHFLTVAIVFLTLLHSDAQELIKTVTVVPNP